VADAPARVTVGCPLVDRFRPLENRDRGVRVSTARRAFDSQAASTSECQALGTGAHTARSRVDLVGLTGARPMFTTSPVGHRLELGLPSGRRIILLALCCIAWLPGCFDDGPLWEFRPVDVVIDPSLSPDSPGRMPRGEDFEVVSEAPCLWLARWSAHDGKQSSEDEWSVEITQLACTQDANGIHAWAAVCSHIENFIDSSVHHTHCSELRGTVRMNAVGVPTAGERRVVSYDLEGRRDDEVVRRTGTFEFEAAEVRQGTPK